MLSNHTLKVLEQKRTYLQTQLKIEGKYLSPEGMKLLNNEMSKVRGMINEASHRHIVGSIEGGALVYTTVNPYGSTSADKVVYIEGLASGWDAAAFDMSSGAQQEVMIDGGQEWSEVITFN